MSIIIFDSYNKKLLDESIDNVTAHLSNFKLLDFVCDTKKIYNSSFSFFEKLDNKDYLIKGSFYTEFVNSLMSRNINMSVSDLIKLERIQLFYFFIESPKPTTPKEIQRWMLYEYAFKKSSLPIKIKVNLNNYEVVLQEFKEQYYNFVIKQNPYLLVKEN